MRRLIALVVVVLMTGCGGSSKSASSSDTTATTAASKPRVQPLMDAAGCVGKPIGTQLFSYETGRCNMPSGGEVTVAVFDSTAKRDQWVDAGGAYGGTIVKGDGWAALVSKPDDATAFAQANHGSA